MATNMAKVNPKQIRKDCFGWKKTKCTALTKIWCGIEGKCNFYKNKNEVEPENICQYCGKAFEAKTPPSIKRKYCSRECAYKGIAIEKKGRRMKHGV